MGKFIDLVGQRFGRLVVMELIGRINNNIRWNCICDCGKTTIVQGGNLPNGNTKSCGCYRKEQTSERITIHGHLKNKLITRIYKCWQHMMERCYNSSCKEYKYYGGRGIKVCERWHKFENFYKDMGNKPEGMTLDRKNNDGDYCLENCRWATKEEQANNKRNNHWIEYQGETKTLAQWARSLDIKAATLGRRLRVGWSIERALTT